MCVLVPRLGGGRGTSHQSPKEMGGSRPHVAIVSDRPEGQVTASLMRRARLNICCIVAATTRDTPLIMARRLEGGCACARGRAGGTLARGTPGLLPNRALEQVCPGHARHRIGAWRRSTAHRRLRVDPTSASSVLTAASMSSPQPTWRSRAAPACASLCTAMCHRASTAAYSPLVSQPRSRAGACATSCAHRVHRPTRRKISQAVRQRTPTRPCFHSPSVDTTTDRQFP